MKESIVGGNVPSFSELGDSPPDSQFLSNIQDLNHVLEKLQNDDLVSPAELTQASEALTKTLVNPDTRSVILSGLLYPGCTPILESFRDQPSIPGLEADTLDDLIELSKEIDDNVRVLKLAQLVIPRLVVPTDRGQYIDNLIDKLSDPDPTQQQSAMQLLRDWNNDEVVPKLKEAMLEANPDIRERINEILHSHLTGEPIVEAEKDPGTALPSPSSLWPEQEPPEAVIRKEENEENFTAGQRKEVGGDGGSGDGSDGTDSMDSDAQLDQWIDRLTSPDPRQYKLAMQELYNWESDDVIAKLQLAKAEAHPEARGRIGEVLYKRLSGEPWTLDIESSFSLSKDIPQSISDLAGQEPPKTSPSSAQPRLDVNKLTTLLGNPETSIATLNALVQIGPPAMSPLCEILMRT